MTEISDSSSRFSQWAAFLVFAAITLFSTLDYIKTTKKTIKTAEKYERIPLCCAIACFTTTLIVVLMHLVPVTSNILVGRKLEGFLSFSLVIVWIVIVIVISDSKNGIALLDTGAVWNGNLYYFSWAGFVCGVTLFVSYLRAVYGVDVAGEIKSRAARLNLWAALLATSMVVTGSSGNAYKGQCFGKDHTGDKKFCRRSIFGISLGANAIFFSASVIIMKMAFSQVSLAVESVVSNLLLLEYIAGVILLTSSAGPAVALGNLYYFTWLSFLVSFMISASCTEDRKAARSGNNLIESDSSGPISSTTLGDDRRNMWIA